MALSKKYLQQQQAAGRIRGAIVPDKPKKDSRNPGYNIPPKKGKALTWLEWNLQYWCNNKALTLERELKFHQERKWRFDFAIESLKIAIEFEGGVYQANSGHNTAKHYTKDTDKYNQATVLGWRVIRVTAINYKTAISVLNEMIKQ